MPRTCVSAAAPGLPDESRLSRRSLLAALPAAGALALPAPASAQGDTEIMKLLREWRSYFDWLEGPATDHMSDDAFNQANLGLHELEDRMFALPCEGPTDVLAKLVAFTMDGHHFADDGGTWSNRILEEAVAAVDRALSERRST